MVATPGTTPAADADSRLTLFLASISIGPTAAAAASAGTPPAAAATPVTVRSSFPSMAPPHGPPRKLFARPTRDSQAQRCRPGKKGSRRRRRHDNDTFADHPFINSLAPPGHGHTSSLSLSCVPTLFAPEEVSILPMSASMPTVFSSAPASMRSVDICEAPSWSSRSASSSGSSGTGNPAAGFLSRQERAQVARLRKWGASCGTDLRALEARVTAFFKDDHEDKKATDRVDTKIEDDKDGGELFQNDFIVLENSDVSNSSWSVVDESDSDAASESSISTVASSSAPSAASSECESDSSCREAVLGRKWIMTHAGRGFNAREKEWAGGWCQVERNDGSGKDTLWLIVRDPLLRVLVHWIARFYGLESSSFDDASIGERMTRVCGSGAQGQGGNRGRRKEQRRGVEAAGAEGTFAAFFLPVSRA